MSIIRDIARDTPYASGWVRARGSRFTRKCVKGSMYEMYDGGGSADARRTPH